MDEDVKAEELEKDGILDEDDEDNDEAIIRDTKTGAGEEGCVQPTTTTLNNPMLTLADYERTPST